jgi:tRNA(Ile)-lysidine synthase
MLCHININEVNHKLTMSLSSIFLESMSDFNIKQHSKVAIAISGGADSMALALLANNWAKYPIITLTVDHKLRPESTNEAEQVSRWMNQKGIEHYILNWEGDKPKSNIQANARNARYELMTEFCKINKIPNLLVAHNKQDQAETLLIRLMRGSGIEGLCGMSDQTTINEIKISRPLLNISKKDLKSYLREQKQGWIEDPSNKDEKYTRVQVRNFINNAEDSDLLIERLAKTTKTLAQSNSYIEDKISSELKQVCDIRSEGYCILAINKFKALHKEAAYKILSKLIKLIGGDYYKPRFEKIVHLYNNIIHGEYSATLGGCEIFASKKEKEQNKLFIVKENIAPQHDLPLSKISSTKWDSRFKITFNEEFTNNFYVGALGKDGFSTLLKKHKEIKQISLPKKVIYTLPALKHLENIVAVPHIHYYEDIKYKDLFKVDFVAEKLI